MPISKEGRGIWMQCAVTRNGTIVGVDVALIVMNNVYEVRRIIGLCSLGSIDI